MIRAFQLAGCLVLAVAASAADQKGNPKPAPPPKNNGAPPRANGGVPNPGARKLGPPLSNPANPITRLYTATPEQRDRVLEKLPPAQQERARKLLSDFDKLPKEQQQVYLDRVQRFEKLPPEKRREFQQSLQAMQKLDPDRKRAVAVALRSLEVMPDAQRNQVLASDQFKNRFSADEQKIILDLSEVILPPL